MSKPVLTLMVGSRNPVKVNAVETVFSHLFADHQLQVEGIDAPSGVAEQPLTDHETRQGAINRLDYCLARQSADYYVAIEGGVDCFADGPATFAYVVVHNGQHMRVGRSAQLPLPVVVFQQLEQGDELGPVMDKLFNTNNIKQKGGAIGALTNGHCSRQEAYQQALTLAMSGFLHPQLYAN